jgi:hypothetical protein
VKCPLITTSQEKRAYFCIHVFEANGRSRIQEIINDKQNPTRKINFAREEIDIKPFTDEQIKKMLGYLRRRKQRQKFFVTVRDYTMIVFLLGTGTFRRINNSTFAA